MYNRVLNERVSDIEQIAVELDNYANLVEPKDKDQAERTRAVATKLKASVDMMKSALVDLSYL